jgi:Zn-dependent protease
LRSAIQPCRHGTSSISKVGTKPNRDISLTFLRDGQTLTTDLRTLSEGRFQVGEIGVQPDSTPVVSSLVKGDVAEKAGLKAGDLLLAVDGQLMTQPSELTTAISRNAGKETDILIRRNGQELHINVTPQKRGDRGMIGIFFGQQTKTFKPGPLEAVKLSVERNIEFGGLIFKTLGGLFVGTTSPRQLMGPVAIAQLSGESAAAGWVALFTLMASISLNLGLLNLMPIPVLDGGHIVIMALEGIARRDFSAAVKEKMLAGRVCAHLAPHGHGHLQRPHAHQLDRAVDAVEKLSGGTSMFRIYQVALAAIIAAALAAPAVAQQNSQVSQADIQRLQESVSQANNEVQQVKSRDAARASQLQTQLDDLRDEVTYLKVKLRKEGSLQRSEYAGVRDRLDDLRSQATNYATASAPSTGSTTTNRAASPTTAPAAGARTAAQTTAGGVEVPSGTEMDVRLTNALNSGTVQVEDRFEGTTLVDVNINGRTVIPAGS